MHELENLEPRRLFSTSPPDPLTQALITSEAITVAKPTTPKNFRATGASPSSVKLAWDDVSGESSYEFEGRVGATATKPASAWKRVTGIKKNTTSWTVTGLEADTRYEFHIRARNSSGTSAWSAIDGGTTLKAATPNEEPPPPPPDPEPTPDPTPTPGKAIVFVGANETLASVEAKQQANTVYVLAPTRYAYSGSRGLKLTAEGAELIGEPGAIIDYNGGELDNEFAAGVEVYGKGNRVSGIEFRGSRKRRGIEVKAGSSDTTIDDNFATVDENGKARLGQLVQVERGLNVKIVNNVCTRLRRYAVFVDHCVGLLIEGNTFGPSDGSVEPKGSLLWFDGEKNVRIYDTQHCVIRGNKLEEHEKSSIEIRQGSDFLVEENDCNNLTVGPLMDGDGDAGDPTMRVDGIEVRNNKIRGEVRLEMGVHGLNFHRNEIWDGGTAIIVRYQGKYASRGCAEGIVSDNLVHADAIIRADAGGTLAGLEITRNVLA